MVRSTNGVSSTVSRRRALKIFGGTGVATALAGCSRSGGGGGEGPITIGLQADLTGTLSNMGYWHDRTMNGYVDYLNENGGIDGREVELEVGDTASDPDDGVDAMRELVQQAGADFVIGSQSSGVAAGSASFAAQQQVPYFAIAKATSLHGENGNRWTFHAGWGPKEAAILLADWGLEEMGENWTVIYQDYAYGQEQNQHIREQVEAAGGQVLDSIGVPLGTTDLTSHLNSVPAETDVLFNALVDPSSANFLRQSADLNTPGERLGIITSVEAIDVSQFGAEAEGSTFISGIPRRLADLDTDSYAHLREIAQVESADQALLNHFWVSYESLSWIKQAVEATGWSDSEDNQELIEWLEGDPSVEESEQFPQGNKHFRGEDHWNIMSRFFLEQIQDGELSKRETFEIDEPLYDPIANISGQEF